MDSYVKKNKNRCTIPVQFQAWLTANDYMGLLKIVVRMFMLCSFFGYIKVLSIFVTCEICRVC